MRTERYNLFLLGIENSETEEKISEEENIESFISSEADGVSISGNLIYF